MNCDFCNEEIPHRGEYRRFPCRTFTVHVRVLGMELAFTSNGDFCACRACEALVVGDNRESLVNRGARDTMGLPEDVALAYVKKVHDGFWESRVLE